jgi:hypothetical protein
MISFRPALTALWLSLFDATQRPHRYLGRALLLDLPVTLALTALVGWTMPSATPDFGKLPPVVLLIGICVFSPLIETLVMMAVFFVLRRLVKSLPYVAMLSAVVWAILHSLNAPAWGLVIFWPFLIFSICYLTWETRSKWQAFAMTASLHALHNAAPGLLLVFFGDH